MANGSEMKIDVTQMAPIRAKQTTTLIRGLNGWTITKKRSMAIAVDVRVDTWTLTPSAIGTRWHTVSPKTQLRSRADIGVKGTASRHIMMSDAARFVMNMFVIVCIDLLRRTTCTARELPEM